MLTVTRHIVEYFFGSPSDMSLTSVRVSSKPHDGQKPGTSGLRKATKMFMQEHYTENFVQCTLSAMGEKLKGSTLVVGGDGRFYGIEASEKIIRMCAANNVCTVSVTHSIAPAIQ
jgi:phosphoglucomutase